MIICYLAINLVTLLLDTTYSVMTNKLIILDIDETLIFGTEIPLDRKPDLVVEPYLVYLRPNAIKFGAFCLDNFHRVAIWTSASEDYATPICKHIFGDRFDQLEFLWCRDRCTRNFNSTYNDWDWIKDLKKVRRLGFSLENIIMIDNTPGNLRRQYGNLVAIKDFEGLLPDQELELLMQYLPSLLLENDIRAIEKRGWRNMVLNNGN